MRTFLHVGPGSKTKSQTTKEFSNPEWKELRLDIDPVVEADILGSIQDMSQVDDKTVDAIYSSHNLEHVYYNEVEVVLSEFLRVLKPDGYVVLTCPDLKSVAAEIVKGLLDEEIYSSPAGPITPLDIVYGHTDSIRHGNKYMAHKCGFTQKTLSKNFLKAGFKLTAATERPAPFYDLWIVAVKAETSEDYLKAIALKHFPSIE